MGYSKITVTFGIYGDLLPNHESFNNIFERNALFLMY